MKTKAIASSVAAISDETTRQLIQRVILAWLHKAGFNRVTEVDCDMPLNDLGIDSLGIMEIAVQLEGDLGKTLNPDLIYELETINELAEYVDSIPSSAIGSSTAPDRAQTLQAGLPVATPAEPANSHSLLSRYQLLNRRVATLKEQDLYFFEPMISRHEGAWVVADGKRMLMLASYDYLGLLSHDLLKGAAIHTINTLGTGHHGSRLLTGTTEIHRNLEKRLADFMETEDAIVFGSGYVTNLAVISALVGPGDCVIGDQWNHASIVDGCRMSGADFLVFAHNDMRSLEDCLKKAGERQSLVVVDAVYSMDGDIAPLPEIIQLCQRYQALVMVDEAHSLGVLGPNGRGIQEHFGLQPSDIDIKMGTVSKSLASSGGFVAASHDIVSFLRHHARGYIFSGALAASQANAAIAALDILQFEPNRTKQLWRNVKHYSEGLTSLGFDIGSTVSPIVPVMTGDIDTTLAMTASCRDRGVLVAPVCYPAVPMDAPRLRTCISAIHSDDDIQFALQTLGHAGKKCGLIT